MVVRRSFTRRRKGPRDFSLAAVTILKGSRDGCHANDRRPLQEIAP